MVDVCRASLTRNEPAQVEVEGLERGGTPGAPVDLQELASPHLCICLDVEGDAWRVLDAGEVFLLLTPNGLHPLHIQEGDT